MLHTSLFCGKCKARVPRGSGISKICHKDFPCLLGTAAPYGNETVKTLINCLKFRGVRGAAEPLAEIAALAAKSAGAKKITAIATAMA